MGDEGIKTKPAQNPLVNLQVYQPQKPREQKQIDPSMYMPRFVPTPMYPPQYTIPYGSGYLQGQYPTVPIVQNYHIGVTGPMQNHAMAALIYENAFPGGNITATMNTTGERITFHDFLRSVMFNRGDGENIGLGGEHNSLLGHIKFNELNPYNTNKLSHNPYRGLPYGFLLYRSCYPIRHNDIGSSVVCAKNSTGVNVRVYRLTEGEYAIHRVNGGNFYDYDQWRDVAWYEFVREHILKRKLCPNFANMFGYYVAEKSGINFDRAFENDPLNPQQSQQPVWQPVQQPAVRPPLTRAPQPQQLQMPLLPPQQTQVPNPNAYDGKALIVLTESSTYSLTGWASLVYQIDGNIRRMINTGHHTERIWMSILFQLMVSLYVMQLKGIYINNFSLDTNVFIKDLTTGGNVTNHWKYNVNGIDYYIPNYGFLLLIDSNYKDLENQNPLHFIQRAQPVAHKLDGEPFGQGNLINNINKNRTLFDMFLRAFNSNNFNGDFINAGGVRPPAEIIRLLDTIHAEATVDNQYDIAKYIDKYMRTFINNRVGTYLKELEVPNVRRDEIRDLKKGNIIINEDGYGTYKFVLYLETQAGVSKILTRNNPNDVDFIEKDVATTSLLNYSKADPIIQNFKINEPNLTENDLLETYTIMRE